MEKLKKNILSIEIGNTTKVITKIRGKQILVIL
jgi:hypothetical protein